MVCKTVATSSNSLTRQLTLRAVNLITRNLYWGVRNIVQLPSYVQAYRYVGNSIQSAD